MAISSRPIPGSPVSGNPQGASRAAGRSVGSLSNYGESIPARQLSVGQVLRGEVSDLRNNEVVVTLEDNTKVAARMENGVSLAIGDTAAFRVKDVTATQVSLETLPKSSAAMESGTISKALDEAGLPKNDKNIAVVRELMQQGMPIHRQAIQNILIQSYAHKDVDVRTLVLMTKQQIPMENGAAEQLQNHIDNVHPMPEDILALADGVADLLQGFASSHPADEAAALGRELLALLFPTPPEGGEGAPEPNLSFLSPAERGELASTLEMFFLPEGQREAILDGTLSLRDAVALTRESVSQALSLDERHLEEQKLARESQLLEEGMPVSEEEMEADLHGLTKAVEAFDIGSVRKIFERYSLLQKENNEVGAVLDRDGIESLSRQLRDFPLNPRMKELVQKGEAPVTDLLIALKNMASLTDASRLKSLLSSREMRTLVRAGLTEMWTLTPEQLKADKAVEKLYDRLYEQTEKLARLAESPALAGQDGRAMEAPAQSLRQNMDFMSTLNQMFPYIELPIRLKEQVTHGDLYVYTKKGALKKNKRNISVLLHLDMPSLGPLDVRLGLNGNVLDSTFYFSTKDAMALVSNNIFFLEDALAEKGYLVHSSMEMQSRSIDIVKDFMEADVGGASPMRYSFDIRA